MCAWLSTVVWSNITPDGDLKPLSNQLKSFKILFSRYCNMDVFKDITWQALCDGFIDIVHYANRYFSITDYKPLELWPKLMIIRKKNPSWKGASLIVEICLCAPFSNATLERFFQSHEHYKIRNKFKSVISIQPECRIAHSHVFYASRGVQSNMWKTVSPTGTMLKNVDSDNENVKHIVNDSHL